MTVVLKTHRFTVDDYHRMGEVGILSEADRVELLAGAIVEMSPIYAQAGIPEAWLLNISEEHLEVHRHPTPDGYQEVRILQRGDSVAPQAFPDLTLIVADLLGP